MGEVIQAAAANVVDYWQLLFLAERGQKVEIAADDKKTVTGKTGDSKEIAAAVKKEDWNEYVVVAKGNHLTQSINGHTTIDVIDNATGKAKASGILALQLHAGPPMTVQFHVGLRRMTSSARMSI